MAARVAEAVREELGAPLPEIAILEELAAVVVTAVTVAKAVTTAPVVARAVQRALEEPVVRMPQEEAMDHRELVAHRAEAV